MFSDVIQTIAAVRKYRPQDIPLDVDIPPVYHYLWKEAAYTKLTQTITALREEQVLAATPEASAATEMKRWYLTMADRCSHRGAKGAKRNA